MRLLTYSTSHAIYLLTFLILVTLVPGCGKVYYKRGGSQQDIERAQQACRGSGDELSACLAEHGWKKPQIDAFDPLFATVEATDNRAVTQSNASPFIELPKEVPPTADTAPVVKKPQPNAIPSTSAPVQSAAAKDPAPAKQSTANDGPDVEYSINSWWKMGAFPDQLKRDQVACEKKLGPSYLPDYKTQTYKRAFVACMHDSGWMAIRNIK